MNHPGRALMLVTDDGHIVIVSRRWRSKWFSVWCTCGKRGRRKDGTCKHQRQVMEDFRPDLKHRARFSFERHTSRGDVAA